jgi:hypothetical protein
MPSVNVPHGMNALTGATVCSVDTAMRAPIGPDWGSWLK